MKGCPQCEFIYEDHQRFCDMDGTELVHNSRSLSLEENNLPLATARSSTEPVYAPALGEPFYALPAPTTAVQAASYERRRLVFVALGGVVLGALVFVIHYVAARHPRPQPAISYAKLESQSVGVGAEKSQVETSNPELETQNSELKSATDSEVNKPDPKTKASSARVKARGRQVEVIGRGVRALDSQSPTLQPSGTRSAQLRLKRRETSQRPETIAQKKESGVTSLLKQTGRILKKPFKF